MKLELHKLLNQFWTLRRSKRITSKQSDLYFFLIQECNVKYWENPFECSNKLIIASIDMQEPTLIDARNRLKQLGLIEFQAGKRNESSPVYRILYLNNLSRNRDESIVKSIDETEVNDVHIEKTKTKTQTKTKLSKSHSEADAPVKKENPLKEPTEYWKPIVESWFVFYKQKFLLEPSFNGQSAQSLKSIVERLKKHSASKGFDWNEQYAVRVFNHFLGKAYENEWLRLNFLLTNLASKYDAIINPNNNGAAKHQQSATGANVNTESAFSKIDKMFT